MFGCTDCADAEEETKPPPMTTKGKTNFLKIPRGVEQKSDVPFFYENRGTKFRKNLPDSLKIFPLRLWSVHP